MGLKKQFHSVAGFYQFRNIQKVCTTNSLPYAFLLAEGLRTNSTRKKKRLIANCLGFVFHMTPGAFFFFLN